jgi:Fanconi anemia group M protein
MFNHTMVCLPTGAGKSMIAFVVMYNLSRWFPRGKVVFVAHTRALLRQQQLAYCKTMGVKEEDTVYLDGQVNQQRREALWKDENTKVFFCTALTLINDYDALDPLAGRRPLRRASWTRQRCSRSTTSSSRCSVRAVSLRQT